MPSEGSSSRDSPPPVVAPSSPLVFTSRALAAGGKRGLRAAEDGAMQIGKESGGNALQKGAWKADSLQRGAKGHPYLQKQGKEYLIVGDGLMAPFLALCLRAHGLTCDLLHRPPSNDVDRGTVALTPSTTQLMGDALGVGVPSGSVLGRVLTFDHIGNDMCDLDLNAFREKGESPTFFACERRKIETALLSLCRVGPQSCTVLPPTTTIAGKMAAGVEALDSGGVRVTFESSAAGGAVATADYRAILTTARDPKLVPELTLTKEELQQREECHQTRRLAESKAVRWIEECVPPLPDLQKHEKRFTPGSQEVVEILTPRGAKLTVRPTMLATKLFYNVALTIPDVAPDPRNKSTSLKQFWSDVVMHWTSGIPGYISHTLFRPLLHHMQEHLSIGPSRSNVVVFKTPMFVSPHWTEGEGRVVKVAHAAHASCYDAIDVSDAQGFADCFLLARHLGHAGKLSAEEGRKALEDFVRERRRQVLEEFEHHKRLVHYGIKERGQLAYMGSRFAMKILRRYKTSWRSILKRLSQKSISIFKTTNMRKRSRFEHQLRSHRSAGTLPSADELCDLDTDGEHSGPSVNGDEITKAVAESVLFDQWCETAQEESEETSGSQKPLDEGSSNDCSDSQASQQPASIVSLLEGDVAFVLDTSALLKLVQDDAALSILVSAPYTTYIPYTVLRELSYTAGETKSPPHAPDSGSENVVGWRTSSERNSHKRAQSDNTSKETDATRVQRRKNEDGHEKERQSLAELAQRWIKKHQIQDSHRIMFGNSVHYDAVYYPAPRASKQSSQKSSALVVESSIKRSRRYHLGENNDARIILYAIAVRKALAAAAQLCADKKERAAPSRQHMILLTNDKIMKIKARAEKMWVMSSEEFYAWFSPQRSRGATNLL